MRITNHLFTTPHCLGSDKKPVEIYFFIDPVCADCWSLEPILKKLQIEYGRYFSIKHILSGKLTYLNMCKKRKLENRPEIFEKNASRSGISCESTLGFKDPIDSPHIASIALKAAELQGRKAGIRFLRKFQEVLFLDKQNITDFNLLQECAKKAKLDVDEFLSDIHSESAAKAFQCDVKITAEMDVQEIPTLVFFSDNAEEEGIKIPGAYPYEIYVHILEELLCEKPNRASLPPLEAFLQFFKFVASSEIAVIYNMPVAQVEREMKKLLLKQKVEVINSRYGTFWRYLEG